MEGDGEWKKKRKLKKRVCPGRNSKSILSNFYGLTKARIIIT